MGENGILFLYILPKQLQFLIFTMMESYQLSHYPNQSFEAVGG